MGSAITATDVSSRVAPPWAAGGAVMALLKGGGMKDEALLSNSPASGGSSLTCLHMIRPKAGSVRRRFNDGHILNIGCGGGRLTMTAGRAGFETARMNTITRPIDDNISVLLRKSSQKVAA
jgi:hypothetical protein